MIRLAIAVLLWGLALAGPARAGEYNDVLSIGDRAPAWVNLPGVDGKKHSLADLKGKKVVVVVFTCNSCPVAQAYEDRIIAFTRKHAGRNGKVAVVAINVNIIPKDRLPRMKERAREKKYNFPYLYDASQKIGKKYGAGYTPEFFVLDKGRKVVYMGAMDDRIIAAEVKVNYLEAAVQAALKGKKPQTAETLAKGCRIRYELKKRKKEER
jgi:peroxiredoxin